MKPLVRYFIALLAAISLLPIIANKVIDSTDRPTLNVYINGEIIEMDIEEYTLRVLLAEGNRCENGEALKALAVSVRSCGAYFALYGLKHDDYNACSDGKCCLSLADLSKADSDRIEECISAAAETEGEILTLDRLPALALFTLCAPSGTRSCEELPYLTAVTADESCEEHYCEIELGINELEEAFPELKTDSDSCLVFGENRKCEFGIFGGKKIEAEQLINTFSLTGYEFTLELGAENAIFKCYGAGHGCGLDICRAERLAEDNFDYRSILEIFYPNLALNKIYYG